MRRILYGKQLLFACVMIMGAGVHAQSRSSYCLAASTAGNCEEHITNVSIGGINNPSNCTNYSDYTGISTSLYAGSQNTLTVDTRLYTTQGYGYPDDQLAVWIDWNGDGDFMDADEEVLNVTYSTSTNFPVTTQVLVPSNVVSGMTRMRVRISYLPDDGPISPCDTSVWGEVEDYSIELFAASNVSWVSQPNDVTINCDQSPNVLLTGTASATSTCPNGIDITYVDEIMNGNCSNNYVIKRIWEANDRCNDVKYFEQLITVIDTVAPNIECPSQQVKFAPNGIDAAIEDYTSLATISDNCSNMGNIGVSQLPLPGSIHELGITLVTLTATDECGLTNSCNMRVEVALPNSVENLQDNLIEIYPNPTLGNIVVRMNENKIEQGRIRVIDSFGKVWYESGNTMIRQNEIIPLPAELKGLLLVEITLENEVYVKRIVKN